ncbi:tyrosine-type recombinase/integrase [Dactylosporangium sp. NPDC049742]|uniref:tyrosine-type recombinase/integrase n=1 Tax=Dactylosporangium sp. NPDC049742 TaxID=3154737 RepID=UPI00342930D3
MGRRRVRVHGPDGRPLHPDAITRRFTRLLGCTDLPPVRLHDLRHGAACLAHAAGADLKTIQQQLGHSTIAVTADIYTTVLPATQRHSCGRSRNCSGRRSSYPGQIAGVGAAIKPPMTATGRPPCSPTHLLLAAAFLCLLVATVAGGTSELPADAVPRRWGTTSER